MRRFRAIGAWLLLVGAPLGRAAVIDRVAAVIDQQVVTTSEITQMAELRFFPRKSGQNDNEYRREILDALIAQMLRYRDVERFGAADISKDQIEARLLEIQNRFATPAEFSAALARAELTLDEVRTLIKRQLQVDAYIKDRFAPAIFVSSDEIEAYYKATYAEQRRARGLPLPPITEVTEEIRSLLRADRLQAEIASWTTQLRSHANVDIYAVR
jgi:peptidyl-prolyl cis-trans isomerase SurA